MLDHNESCMHLVSHIKKIRLIEGVHHARRRVLNAREKEASRRRSTRLIEKKTK